jgi:hypothetical protein
VNSPLTGTVVTTKVSVSGPACTSFDSKLESNRRRERLSY